MFEIINNVVKELTILRNAQSQQRQFGLSPVTLNEFYKSMEPIDNKVLVSDNEKNDDDSASETSGSEYDSEDGESDNSEEDESDDEDLQGSIKIVNVNINDKIDVEEIETSLNDIDDVDNECIDDNNGGITPLEVDEIHVEKLGSSEPLVEDVDDSVSISSANKGVYKKMTLSALKTIAITKGLCSDASKLKKTDLLKLLEESE
jgi:hypothetical protein